MVLNGERGSREDDTSTTVPRVLGFKDGNSSDVFADPLPTATHILGGRKLIPLLLCDVHDRNPNSD